MTVPRPITYLLRLGITIAAMALAFSQVPAHEVMPMLTAIPWPYLLCALLLTHAGQIISAMRTRYYLQCQQVELPANPALRLHYVGGLFNAFLPGGVGGDAYKAWWLKRHRQERLLNMVTLMIAGRLNGLWALGILLCIMGGCSAPIRQLVPYAAWLFVIAALAGTAGYSLFARMVLREPVRQQMRAAIYSLGVQLMLVAVAYALCSGLGLNAAAPEYVVLFMLSCMLAMLPLSIGGIGIRELALLHGSRLLGLSEQSGIALAFAFTLLALTIPVVGACIHHFYAPENHS